MTAAGGEDSGSFIFKALQEEWSDTQVSSLEMSSLACTLVWNLPRFSSKYSTTPLECIAVILTLHIHLLKTECMIWHFFLVHM